MTTDLAPARRGLPTSYAGHVFRSRLEARFAVLFDTMGIRWEFEPEGFELPHGLYVPDFWLPDLRTWVEVKPDPELVVESPVWELANELAYLTGNTVCVAPGLDYLGIGPIFFALRYPHVHNPKAELGYFTELRSKPAFAYVTELRDNWGPTPLRSATARRAMEKAKAATFERPSRIPAYPLVAR